MTCEPCVQNATDQGRAQGRLRLGPANPPADPNRKGATGEAAALTCDSTCGQHQRNSASVKQLCCQAALNCSTLLRQPSLIIFEYPVAKQSGMSSSASLLCNHSNTKHVNVVTCHSPRGSKCVCVCEALATKGFLFLNF